LGKTFFVGCASMIAAAGQKLISAIHHGGTLRSKFMHKIAGLFLAVMLIGTVSFSQSAPPKPAANPAPKTAAHSAAKSPQIPIPE
jgi:hypothetical protein